MSWEKAQGMIEFIRGSAIKNNIKWSGYYIMAAENGSAGTVNTSNWEQVWQYGSDLGQANADPMWQQDGVAPQAAIKGLEITTQKSGRAFTPRNQGIPKGFVESHSIGNYGWIFERVDGVEGYVTQLCVASTNRFFAHTWSNRYLRVMKRSAKAENTLERNSLMRSMAWGNCQIIH